MNIGTSINDSATIVGKATAALADSAYLAVKFDANGGIVKTSTAGEAALGLLPAEQSDIAAGGRVTVQIKEMGLWKVGAAVAAGAELTADAAGKAVAATSGAFILAVALGAATAANQVIPVQIVKAGYKSGGIGLGDLTDIDLSTDPTDGQVLKYVAADTKWKAGADATA